VVKRRVCSESSCGAIYHLDRKPPKTTGLCDLCGSPLKHRSDDTAEAFRSRMETFNATFKPLQAYYEGSPNYRLVDGSGTPDEVYEVVVKIFEERA